MLRKVFLSAVAALIVTRVNAQELTTPQPHEVTAQGIIADDATQRYKQAIEKCPGKEPTVDCFKKQAQIEERTLNEIYRGTLDYLKGKPAQTTLFRHSQRAWVDFRKIDCDFARSLFSRNEDQERAFYDCMLRKTVDRQAELRSLVGD
jgi:uncharacterized protein YecT (DUF1311 family)